MACFDAAAKRDAAAIGFGLRGPEAEAWPSGRDASVLVRPGLPPPVVSPDTAAMPHFMIIKARSLGLSG